jgi:hypothetical protein
VLHGRGQGVSAAQSVPIETELAREQLVLPVGLDLLDRVVGRVLVDDLEHRHLIVPAPVPRDGLKPELFTSVVMFAV